MLLALRVLYNGTSRTGSTDSTLDSVVLTGTARLSVKGRTSATLSALTVAATGKVYVKAQLGSTLADVSLTGSGAVTTTVIHGNLGNRKYWAEGYWSADYWSQDWWSDQEQVFDALTLSASGTVASAAVSTGTLDVTLDALTLSASNAVPVAPTTIGGGVAAPMFRDQQLLQIAAEDQLLIQFVTKFLEAA